MTKPTGRPRGRPKSKEYVTLMARVDVALADQVKRYASLHRQPLSVVIRDALTLLMDEYPAWTARSGPHRLAEREFMSDRYESPLDTLLGETDSAERATLLSDTNEAVVETILSDMKRDEHIVSDTKEEHASILSDIKEGSSDIMSDTKTATAAIMSDTNTPIPEPARAGNRVGRAPGLMHRRITALLAEHPEGLSAEQIRVALQADKPMGDTLYNMKRRGALTTRGEGHGQRYVLA
jgi:hypothetical protein